MKASELKIDLSKERIDFAVMIGIYVGNLAAEFDFRDCTMDRDYDSFNVIQECIDIANNHDYEMEFDDEWLIDTETERENAWNYAKQIVSSITGVSLNE